MAESPDDQSLDLQLHHLMGLSFAKLVVVKRLREAMKLGQTYDLRLISAILNDLQDEEVRVANEAPLSLGLGSGS